MYNVKIGAEFVKKKTLLFMISFYTKRKKENELNYWKCKMLHNDVLQCQRIIDTIFPYESMLPVML